MSNAPQVHAVANQSQDSLDDAEKGVYDSTVTLIAPPPFVYAVEGRLTQLNPLLSPVSPVHEGITPCTSVPELKLPKSSKNEVSHVEVVAQPKKSAPVKRKISRWILFELWFNVYRRFFTFVVVFNLIGIILAATGHFRYAENHLGALVLGNLLMAILMRNELFVRFLYLVAIYGLRSVRSPHCGPTPLLTIIYSGRRCASSWQSTLRCSIWEVFTRVVRYPAQRKFDHSGKDLPTNYSAAGLSTRSST